MHRVGISSTVIVFAFFELDSHRADMSLFSISRLIRCSLQGTQSSFMAQSELHDFPSRLFILNIYCYAL